jgi:hypothetical protein
MKNLKWGLMIALAAIAFIAALFYNSMSYSQFRVEVCMEFAGRTNCRTALGATEELALRTAVDNACATISSGMTDSMACSGKQPQSIKWLKGK